MKHTDKLRLKRAFTEMPSELPGQIELAFRRGELAMKRRHKWMVSLSVAAACAVIFAALALAAGQLTRPRPDRVVVAQGREESENATVAPEAMYGDETEGVLLPDVTPEPAIEIDGVYYDVTPEPTPMPTPKHTPTPAPDQAEPALTIVYTQPQSNYYHSDPSCSGMEGAIEWTEASAVSVGKRPCPICIGADADALETPLPTNTPKPLEEPREAPVYYTEKGVYYHGLSDCSGMVGADAHTFAETQADGKQRCPVCQPGEPDHYDLFKTAFGQGLEALVPGYAYSYCSGATGFFDDGAWYVTDGEDTLRACGAASYLKSDGGEYLATGGAGNALEDVMCFTFDARECDELWPFLNRTAVGERALRETDEAVEAALEAEQLNALVDVEEQDVWVAVSPEGLILELDVRHVSLDRAVYVNVSYILTGDGYARDSRVAVIEPIMDDAVEPTDISEAAEEITRRRYICDSDGYYHADKACTMLSQQSFEAVSRAEAAATGRAACPLCQPDSPLDRSLFLMAFGRSMLSDLMPDYYYAFTRATPYTGGFSWYVRSREDENTYGTLATFETRPGSEDAPVPDNFEDGGVRMKVWMNQEADYVSMLKDDAPEPMRSMAARAEAELMDMPGMAMPDGRSPLGWNMWIYVCFDAAREKITSVDFFVTGPEEVHFQWQRNGEDAFDLVEIAVNSEGLG